MKTHLKVNIEGMSALRDAVEEDFENGAYVYLCNKEPLEYLNSTEYILSRFKVKGFERDKKGNIKHFLNGKMEKCSPENVYVSAELIREVEYNFPVAIKIIIFKEPEKKLIKEMELPELNIHNGYNSCCPNCGHSISIM